MQSNPRRHGVTTLLGKTALAAVAAAAFNLAAPLHAQGDYYSAPAFYLTGNFLQLPVSPTGNLVVSDPTRTDTSSLVASTNNPNEFGGRYDPSGKDAANGVDFWKWGTPVYDYTIAYGGDVSTGFGGTTPANAVYDGDKWATAPTVTNTSTASTESATITGSPFAGLSFSRDISFGVNDKFVSFTDTVTNTGTTTFSKLATLDDLDPDQTIFYDDVTYATDNSVVSRVQPNDTVVATGATTDSLHTLSIALTGDSAYKFVSIAPLNTLTATDPYTFLAAPNLGPNVHNDQGIMYGDNFGDLTPGASETSTWYMVFGNNFADVTPPTIIPTASVPEPGSVSLVLVGLGGLLVSGRRLRRRA